MRSSLPTDMLGSLLGVLVLVFIFLVISSLWRIYGDKRRNLLHIPGPTPLPLFGNALLFVKDPTLFMSTVADLCKRYGKVLRVHLAHRPNAIVWTPEAFEKILSSNQQITKGFDYKFLLPWLGTGLLTSTSSKWHTRRKMLTPAFHFRILEDFLIVMNDQSDILCDQVLLPLSGTGDVDIFPLVTHCALDIICETAMGRSINAQANGDTEYVRAIYGASDYVFQRQKSPWFWDDLVFALSPQGRKMKNMLSILHGFTNKVIKERKEELKDSTDDSEKDDNDVGIKRRLAFLDLLIDASKGGTVLSDEDIREEVDTFMFEGHDTTATNMSFTLWLLASHPEIQEKCREELEMIFEGEERQATSQDLSRMKYLEQCIKESLRLYQSVPFISRTIAEEVEIEGYTIPAGTNVIMAQYILHRDPKTFPDPDTFNPERFSPDSGVKRHPYSYVPFSAGPRNCIGQKFAMMEEKVVVSAVLRKYRMNTNMKVADIPLLSEVILRPKNGLNVSFERI